MLSGDGKNFKLAFRAVKRPLPFALLPNSQAENNDAKRDTIRVETNKHFFIAISP